MTRRPRVPGLNDDWAHAQLLIPSAPCPSCTLLTQVEGQPWDCDPDRPGCPLHDTPEQTRARVTGPSHLESGHEQVTAPRAAFCPACRHALQDHDPDDGCGACAMAMAGRCHPRTTR